MKREQKDKPDSAWLANPLACLPCGAHDGDLFTPVHYDCANCKRIIAIQVAALRPPPVKLPARPQGLLFDGAHPKRLRR